MDLVIFNHALYGLSYLGIWRLDGRRTHTLGRTMPLRRLIPEGLRLRPPQSPVEAPRFGLGISRSRTVRVEPD